MNSVSPTDLVYMIDGHLSDRFLKHAMRYIIIFILNIYQIFLFTDCVFYNWLKMNLKSI